MSDELFPLTLVSMIINSIECLLTATLLTAACALTSKALAKDLTIYSNVGLHVHGQNEAKNFELATAEFEKKEIRHSEKGKVAGKSYSISTTAKRNNKTDTGTRAVTGVMQLPVGTLWSEITVFDIPQKATPLLGYTNRGIILEVSGAYASVTGTYDLELSKDAKYI